MGRTDLCEQANTASAKMAGLALTAMSVQPTKLVMH
jgi:hypothetical protein